MPSSDHDNATRALAEAVDGLLMPSESDAAFTVITWPTPPPLDPTTIPATLGLPLESPLETHDLARFFAPLTRQEAAADPVAQQRAARFAHLRATLEHCLRDISVYRVGTVEITVLILGTTQDDRLLGLRTTVIET